MNAANFAIKTTALAGFLLIILGFKLFFIFFYGNATPYWDQWDAEAANLYKPILENNYNVQLLFSSHNEHRILITRLLGIFLLKINGIWNPLLQMSVNAVLHTGVICILVILTGRVLGKYFWPALMIIALALFIIPFGWENTLAGFQSQFYFVILFSVVSLSIITNSTPFTMAWFLGVFLGICAYFSLSSGVFVFAVACVSLITKSLISNDFTKRNITAILFFITLFTVEFHFITLCHYHDSLKASSFNSFITSFAEVAGWPLRYQGSNLKYLFPLLIYAPTIVYFLYCLKNKELLHKNNLFLLGIVAFIIANEASISYGRAIGNLSSRYTDIYLLGLYINFAYVLLLVKRKKKFKIATTILSAFWVFIVILSLYYVAFKNIPAELNNKKNYSLLEQSNTKKFVESGDIESLMNKGYLEIPYPDPLRLSKLLSDSTIRSILPKSICVSNQTGTLDTSVNYILSCGMYLIAIGSFIFILSLILMFRFREEQVSPTL